MDHLNFGVFRSSGGNRNVNRKVEDTVCGAEMGQLREAQEIDIRHKLRKLFSQIILDISLC